MNRLFISAFRLQDAALRDMVLRHAVLRDTVLRHAVLQNGSTSAHFYCIRNTEAICSHSHAIIHSGSVFHDGFPHDQPAETCKHCKYYQARHHSVIRICAVFEAEGKQECVYKRSSYNTVQKNSVDKRQSV